MPATTSETALHCPTVKLSCAANRKSYSNSREESEGFIRDVCGRMPLRSSLESWSWSSYLPAVQSQFDRNCCRNHNRSSGILFARMPSEGHVKRDVTRCGCQHFLLQPKNEKDGLGTIRLVVATHTQGQLELGDASSTWPGLNHMIYLV